MKTILLALTLTCALFLTANTYPFRVIDDALFLSELTFPYAKEEIKNLVLYLHDPTCVPCQTFKTEFHKAARKAKKFSEDPYYLSFGFVDVTQEAQIHKDLGIKHFPALFFFKDNQLYHAYGGPLDADSILDWAQSCFDLPYKKFETLDKQELFGSYGIALLLFGDANPEITSAMIKAAKNHRNYVQLFRTDSEVIFKNYNVSNGWVLLTTKTGFNDTFHGPARLESIEASLEGQVSALPTYLDNTFANTMETMRIAYYCYFTKEGVDDTEEFKTMVAASKQLRLNSVKFCTANVDTPLGATLAEMLGIKKKNTPTVGIIDTTSIVPNKYKFDGEMTTTELVKFYELSVVSKKNPFYLVEKLADDEKPKRGLDYTITLSRDNFNKTILEGDKPALVLFCAPLEIACRGFENTFRSLAYQLRDNDINVARVDTSKNDLDEKIDTYPLLVWYTSKGDRGTRYSGPTNINNVKKWLKNEFKVKFDD